MPETEHPPEYQSLVRYTAPVLVTSTEKLQMSTDMDTAGPKTVAALLESKKETEEILHAILPPHAWEVDGQMWQQVASPTPATAQDVINLQKELEARLEKSKARETSICPIRRKLYAECLDEVIRQITISAAERGLLLVRIRDEANMSIDAYETLYCSSVIFGIRKAVQAHEEKETLRKRVKMMEAENAALQAKIAALKLKLEQWLIARAERRAKEEKKYARELAFLRKTNTQLKAQLDFISAPKK